MRTPLDYIVLGSVSSPGTVELSGHDRNEEWDIKAAKGQTGASTTRNGAPVGQFQATFYLVDDEEREQWDAFQRLIESTTSGPAPIALSIYHPDLARNRFTEVVSGGVGGLKHDGKGGSIVVVKFLEFRPPKPVAPKKPAVKPSAGITAPGRPPPKPDPNAAAKEELAGLLNRARQP